MPLRPPCRSLAMSGNFGSTAAGGFGGVASFLSLRLGSPIAKRRVEVGGETEPGPLAGVSRSPAARPSTAARERRQSRFYSSGEGFKSGMAQMDR
jgi:hypothetical protein